MCACNSTAECLCDILTAYSSACANSYVRIQWSTPQLCGEWYAHRPWSFWICHRVFNALCNLNVNGCMGFIGRHKKIPIWNYLVMFCWNLSIENTRVAFSVGQTDRSKKPTLVYLLFWITMAAVVNVINRFTSTSLLRITQDITLPYCSEHSHIINYYMPVVQSHWRK